MAKQEWYYVKIPIKSRTEEINFVIKFLNKYKPIEFKLVVAEADNIYSYILYKIKS